MTSKKHERYDRSGLPIEIGDWVRLVEIPANIKPMPRETKSIFKQALGHTFKVEGFNQYGFAELKLSKKIEWGHTIWVELFHLERSRRRRSGDKKP
ncbi:MAG: hypothetical protein ACYSW7_11120 [Planctomycetota bacterium]|jgi:hypothetical protein